MRFHLRGYYGHQNTGDDALAAGTVFGLERIAPGSDYRVAATRRLVLPVAPDRARFLPARQRFRGHLRLAGLAQALRCSWTVFGGGSLINDVAGTRSLRRKRLLVRFLKRTGHNVAMLGMGVGPLTTEPGRRAARAVLGKTDVLTVRDEISADACEAAGLRRPPVVGDLALLLARDDFPPPSREPRLARGAEPVLGVAVCNYHQYIRQGDERDRRRLEKIASALRGFCADRACEVALFEFNGHPARGDRPAVEGLRQALAGVVPVRVLDYDPDPAAVLADFRACDAVLAMRLHAAVFAFMAERPMVMLSYHPKCAGFARQVGLDDAFVLDSETFTPANLRGRLDQAMDHPDAATAGTTRAGMIERAMVSFVALSRHLGPPAPGPDTSQPAANAPAGPDTGRCHAGRL